MTNCDKSDGLQVVSLFARGQNSARCNVASGSPLAPWWRTLGRFACSHIPSHAPLVPAHLRLRSWMSWARGFATGDSKDKAPNRVGRRPWRPKGTQHLLAYRWKGSSEVTVRLGQKAGVLEAAKRLAKQLVLESYALIPRSSCASRASVARKRTTLLRNAPKNEVHKEASSRRLPRDARL